MKKGEIMGTWHTYKRFMVALLLAVIQTLIMSAWNTTFLLRTLDTNPPIVERVNQIEFRLSEQGRVNQAILDELREARRERATFRREQARRTPMINYTEKKMGAK